MKIRTVARLMTGMSLLLGLLSASVSAQTLSVLAEENPPFHSAKAAPASGLATDLLLAMTKKAGIALEASAIKTQPWARVYDAIQTQPNTLVFPMAKVPAREALFQWVGPIYKVQIGLIAPKAKKLSIPNAEAAKKFKIGTVRDGAPEQAIVAAGVPVDLLDRGNNLVSNLQKLQAGRIDMLAFNATAAAHNMPPLGMTFADYEVVFVMSEPQLYYAFSKDTPAATIKALQTALDALKTDGSYDKLVKTYIK